MHTPDQPIHHEIDGVKYVCLVQPAIQANQSLIRLLRTFSAPTIALLSGAVRGFASEKGELTIAGLGGMDLTTGLMMLFSELTPENAQVILSDGLVGIRTEGHIEDLSDPKVFDAHFRGRIMHMYKVFAWSLGCNYRDFLDVARSVDLKKLSAMAKSLKQSKLGSQSSQCSTSPTVTPESSDSSTPATH